MPVLQQRESSSWPHRHAEMADRLRDLDWAVTPLGPLYAWPATLRTIVDAALVSQVPMLILWGADLIQIPNDAFHVLTGTSPGDYLGRPYSECWPRSWSMHSREFARMLTGATTDWSKTSLIREDGDVEITTSFSPLLDEAGDVAGVLGVAFDTSEALHLARKLRELDARHAFLLKLSDAIRPLEDPIAVQEVATRLLGEHMRVDRAGFSELEANEEWMCVARDWHAPGAPSIVGRYRMDEFGKFFTQPIREGGFSVIEDALNDPRVNPATFAQTWGAVHTRAAIAYGIVKGGRLCAAFFVHAHEPRKWTDAEVALVSDVSERTWEALQRARSEAALRASETRFRQFGDASSDALWIRDADTLAMEYASPAMRTLYGIVPETILGDPKHWAALIVPEDRDAALGNLERARREPVVHEFRVLRPSDGMFRWLRSTDFPLYDEQGRLQRIAGITSDVTEAKQSTEHQSVLLSELQHRVRNIMAMIRSITARTSVRAQSVDEYASLVGGRLLALARVQTLLTRGATKAVDMAAIVRDEIEAQAQHEDQYTISGPTVAISPKAAEVLTLAIHELSTNALKYGALSVADGRVSVSWSIATKRGKPWLALTWIEQCVPCVAHAASAPQRRGFGSELIEGLIPYELGGVGRLALTPDGAQCFLEFPIKEGSSILETDAPKRASIFGGALDMSGQANLTGQRILVVEDDYYLATDTARAIQGAGAAVVGPCPNQEAALDEITLTVPSGAVLDLNLGNGPSFDLARMLRQRNIPLLLITGYDAKIIPEEFNDVPRLQKPVTVKQIVNTLGDVLMKRLTVER